MIIFATPFTGKTPRDDNRAQGWQEWYDHRVNIFENYTLKSLENQTDKDFLIWLQFSPQDKDNPTTDRIEKLLKKSKLKYLMTFNSPIMMEDKATWHNEDLIQRAELSLSQIKVEDDWVCEVGLDSDDMVSKNFVEFLKSRPPKERQAFYMNKGFIVTDDDRVADWCNPISMSIYAIVYPKSIYLDANKRFEYQNGFNSHEQIPDKFDAEKLPDGMYCATVHGKNISTTWGHPFMGKEYYYDEEKLEIKSNFGI